MKHGPYDLLITESIQSELSEQVLLKESIKDSPERLVPYLIDFLGRRLSDLLESIDTDDENLRVRSQIEMVNGILRHFEQALGTEEAKDTIPEQVELLKWLGPFAQEPSLPKTGLTHTWLFTAGKGSPSLLNELRSEMTSCDSLDLLVSFITVSGVRKIRDILESITAADASGKTNTQIRILTTTYTGATEKKALDELARLPGCEVRVSLDGRRTRLHAKAWIFRRDTGFGTAYVGSANLSAAAMTGGLEWTVKFSQRAQAALYERACANFETLWEDQEFQRYNPDDPEHEEALTRALCEQRGGATHLLPAITFLEVTPKPFQQEILDQLEFEREHGRHRNLLVAATGTGKTVMAALDYRRFAKKIGGKPRLLFVSHRIQIVSQARSVFRQVLGDSQFGELLDGNNRPETNEHLFAVVNSVNSQGLLEYLGPAYWAMVIIDECHHIAANSFRVFAQTVTPKILLGLTATPERADGQSITQFFDARPDGAPAAELRLWHALDLQLLCPFEYYGCDDDTDFSKVRWSSTSEVQDLAAIVDANDIRAHAMLREWNKLCSDPRQSKTLIFCVTKTHAEFIANFLTSNAIKALAVHSGVGQEVRQAAPRLLATGEISAIVTVDLYNEGIDLPYVDTLIMLRPTQSSVVLQQQVGRGLRLYEKKESCLILDFVGQHVEGFRFDRLLSGITGLNRQELKQGLEEGFPSLPSGCHLFLQKKTKQQVLGQLKDLINQRWNVLATELRALAALNRNCVSLIHFINNYNLELNDVYRKSGRSGWLNLLEAAGLLDQPLTITETKVSEKLGRLIHFDDPQRIDALKNICSGIGTERVKWAKSLYFLLESRTPDENVPIKWLESWLSSDKSHDELQSVQRLLESKCRLLNRPIPGLENTSLCLHASYTPSEIGVALGWFTSTRQSPITAGVLSLKEKKTEIFFVTLDKSEGFHESIAYKDCAISQTRFKWQSQNSAKPHTMVGKRYLESAKNGWQFQLFVRVRKSDPFKALGPLKLHHAEGCGPMTIYWDLECPMGAMLFREFNVIGDI